MAKVTGVREENEQLLVTLKKLDRKRNVAEEQRDKVASMAVKDAEDAKVNNS